MHNQQGDQDRQADLRQKGLQGRLAREGQKGPQPGRQDRQAAPRRPGQRGR